MKRLFTIFSLPLFALLTFFSLPTSHAEAECQIVPSGTHFRPEGTFNSYDDDNRPWVYVDVQTTGCVTSPSNVLKFQFFDTDTSTSPLSERFIQNVSVEIGDPGALTTNSDFKTSQDQFTLPILLGEEGVGDCNFDDNTNWAIFALNPALGALTSYFADIPDCMIFAKVVHVGTGQLIHSIGSVSSPKWIYECDYLCTTSWVVGGACAPNNEPLAYGPPNVCPQDTGLISNFTGLDNIDTSQSATYSTDALAPLPGFSDNPDHLGVWLKSLFTILIVIAGILALIMIVVGGLTYMTSDAFGKKTQGRMYIINALSGLVLALGAWVVLNTINPDLASNLSISIPNVSTNPDFEPEDSVGEGVDQITLNLSGGGTTTMTACDTSQIVNVTAFGKTFPIHQGLVSSIQSIDAAWQAMPVDTRYQVNTIYGYNCRRVRGTTAWSSHAFGTAVDINPTKNPFGINLVTDMPTSFRDLWTSHGWGWGGSWNSKKDAMHFSKYPTSEGGDGVIGN